MKINERSGGSARWSAPELLDSNSQGFKVLPTQKSDIWSFGCVWYEVSVVPFSQCLVFNEPQIITGKSPFEEYKEEVSVVRALIIRKEIPAKNVNDARLEKWAWTMMKNCWEYKPLARPKCDDINSKFFSSGYRRSPNVSGEDHTLWKKLKEWNSPIDYIYIRSILQQALGSSEKAMVVHDTMGMEECYKLVSAIGNQEWRRFTAGLGGEDAQLLADYFDLVGVLPILVSSGY